VPVELFVTKQNRDENDIEFYVYTQETSLPEGKLFDLFTIAYVGIFDICDDL
jgi:hypothetical protein